MDKNKLKVRFKSVFCGLWQRTLATFRAFAKSNKFNPPSPIDPELNCLSWAETQDICRARNQWLQAKASYQHIDLSNKQADAAILYLEMCERRYLGLLQEVRQDGRACNSLQLAWWTLTTCSCSRDANLRCGGGLL